jgi:hypothetical protein
MRLSRALQGCGGSIAPMRIDTAMYGDIFYIKQCLHSELREGDYRYHQ